MNEVKITTEFIKLDQFLKFAGIVQTGGQASMLIQDGIITVNDDICLKRGKKLRTGDIIEIEDYDTYLVI